MSVVLGTGVRSVNFVFVMVDMMTCVLTGAKGCFDLPFVVDCDWMCMDSMVDGIRDTGDWLEGRSITTYVDNLMACDSTNGCDEDWMLVGPDLDYVIGDMGNVHVHG